MNKKNILICIGVLIVCLSLIGISYSFFTTKISNEGIKDNVIKAAKLELLFRDNNPNIEIPYMQPGAKVTKTFTVTNNSDKKQIFNIKIKDVINTLVDKTDLRYKLKKDSEVLQELSLPSGEAYIKDKLEIEVGKTDTYTLEIEYISSKTNQNDNQGKRFKGTIDIDIEEDIIIATNPKVTLYEGMIPVIYDGEGNVVVADTNDKLWYDYTAHEWANAVLVDSTNYNKYRNKPNTIIPMEEILQMYVYIPRYKYQLFNTNNESKEEQMINIIFENDTENTGDIKCEYTNNGDGTITENCTNKTSGEPAQNGEWYTHPAFTFGDTELPGIWVGKFEPSHIDSPRGDALEIECLTSNCDSADGLKIVPNATALRSGSIGKFFYLASSIVREGNHFNLNSSIVDSHVIKNMEWGAIAYLTNSKYGRYNNSGSEIEDGARIWNNNISMYITGCSEESPYSAYASECYTDNKWNGKNGPHASTTNNIYGIYDMAGGSLEYVMGVMLDETGKMSIAMSELPYLENKYYDAYSYSTNSKDISRGHLGDGTRETLKETGESAKVFFGNEVDFVDNLGEWMLKGNWYNDSISNIFSFGRSRGTYWGARSFRVVLTAQDGAE